MSRLRLFLFAAVVVIGLANRTAPCAAQATAPHGDRAPVAHNVESHEGRAENGTPNILSGDLGNVVWTLAIFFVLLGVLRAFAWKPILLALKRREEFIHDSLENARKERADAERMMKEYAERIEKARLEASAIVDEGKRDAEAVRKRLHEETKKEADDMIARAKREIGIARDDAVKDLYDRTLTLSTETAGKIIRRQLTPGDHRVLLDESLAEMAKAEH